MATIIMLKYFIPIGKSRLILVRLNICLTWTFRTNINLDFSIGMKYINMIIVVNLALRFLSKIFLNSQKRRKH